MMLSTSSGDFLVPETVEAEVPSVPPIPHPDEPEYEARRIAFGEWLDAEPQHLIDYERLRRWQIEQNDLAAAAARDGRSFTVTRDGLE
ncbi:hypothetical protein [Brevundimonas goettingensis]|uniref:Uncharacterized protein n=1 Tax=Brevundimonas goettingensis TaxID=2774190 RepID=A0A975C0H9_9CAUL|nr:hypothetical protein [Brevundimonas goettingensis]QTC91190.1 hypothetical protein IFJ75_18665 [Brevundimonas goettingensis]